MICVFTVRVGASPAQQGYDSKAVEDNLAILPAPAPNLSPSAQQRLSLNSPRGIEQYLQEVKAAMRQHGAQWPWTKAYGSGSPAPAPAAAPAYQPEWAPEVAEVTLSDFNTWSDETGTSIGNGTLNMFAKNGTLLSQTPYSAPLVPRSVLERDLVPMKLNSAGAASIEFINATVPTVTPLSFSLSHGLSHPARLEPVCVDVPISWGYLFQSQLFP